jgi:hypothetical protein
MRRACFQGCCPCASRPTHPVAECWRRVRGAFWVRPALAGLEARDCAKYALRRSGVSARSSDKKRSSDGKPPGSTEGTPSSGAHSPGAVSSGNGSSSNGSSGNRSSGHGSSSGARQAVEKRDPDVAIVCGVSDDGQSVDIIRKRGERIEAGTVRRLEQGKPIHGEVVRLRPREHFPMICDVEVEVPAPGQPEASASTSGPAQVATETYRKNWDAIYGRGRKPGSMLN